jgi:hypothetical protein
MLLQQINSKMDMVGTVISDKNIVGTTSPALLASLRYSLLNSPPVGDEEDDGAAKLSATFTHPRVITVPVPTSAGERAHTFTFSCCASHRLQRQYQDW